MFWCFKTASRTIVMSIGSMPREIFLPQKSKQTNKQTMAQKSLLNR